MIKMLLALALSLPLVSQAADVVKKCSMSSATMVAPKKFIPALKGFSTEAYIIEHSDSFTYIDTLGVKYRSGKLVKDGNDLAYEDKENSIVYATNNKRTVYAVIYPEQERARVFKNCKNQ